MTPGTVRWSVAAAASALTCSLAVSGELSDPVRLEAGDKLLGENRLYPSPVYHDMNGDGLLDIVVGDLRGLLTVAYGMVSDGAPKFAAEVDVKALDGELLDFHNW